MSTTDISPAPMQSQEKQLNLKPKSMRLKEILARLQIVFRATGDIELANAIGIRSSNIANWRFRSSIPYDTLISICGAKGLSIEWVFNGTGPVYRSDLKAMTSNQQHESLGYMRIPVVEQQAKLRTFPKDDYNFTIYRRDWIERFAENVDALRLYMIEDQAMEPKWVLGNIVIVDTSVSTPYVDGFYLIQLSADTSLSLRWVRRLIGENKLQFVVFNTTLYKVEEIPVGEESPKIIGKLLCDVMRRY